jgi:CRP-like cAMP-binding protein
MYNKYLNILANSPLFDDIGKIEAKRLIGCIKPIISKYDSGEIIAAGGAAADRIGIVVSGAVDIVKYGPAGNRIILDTVGGGDMFGETAAFTKEGEWPATVESHRETRVLFITASSITASCKQLCPAHTQIQKNMLSILSEKTLRLTRRMAYMGMKRLNTRICTYLLSVRDYKKANTFTIPMKRYEMAEFFNVERPSLSRELVNLKKEKVIDFKGNKIKLLDIDRIKKISSGRTS